MIDLEDGTGSEGTFVGKKILSFVNEAVKGGLDSYLGMIQFLTLIFTLKME